MGKGQRTGRRLRPGPGPGGVPAGGGGAVRDGPGAAGLPVRVEASMVKAMDNADARARSSACMAVATALAFGTPEDRAARASKFVASGLLLKIGPRLLDGDLSVAVHAVGALR